MYSFVGLGGYEHTTPTTEANPLLAVLSRQPIITLQTLLPAVFRAISRNRTNSPCLCVTSSSEPTETSDAVTISLRNPVTGESLRPEHVTLPRPLYAAEDGPDSMGNGEQTVFDLKPLFYNQRSPC